MKNKYPKTSGGFDDAYILQSLHNKNQQLKRWSKIIANFLPLEFQDSVFVLSYQNQQLLLGTQEQLLASKLRYLLPQLQDNLQRHPAFTQLASIKLKVTPASQVNSVLSSLQSNTIHFYSDESAQILSEFSDSLGEDPEEQALRNALNKLAGHIKSKNKKSND